MATVDLAHDDAGRLLDRELAGCLRDPEVILLDNAGHLPNLERPDEFNEHLLRFLTRAFP